MNDTSQNEFVDAYRDALNKAGFNPKNVLMSMPTKKFNKHSKVLLIFITQTREWKLQNLLRFYPSTITTFLYFLIDQWQRFGHNQRWFVEIENGRQKNQKGYRCSLVGYIIC